MGVPPILLPNGRVDTDAHHVLVVLASRAKPDGGDCRPGLDWLARHSYRTPESAQRALDALQSAGLIEQCGDLNGTPVWRLCMAVVSHGRTVLDERQDRKRAQAAERQRRRREALRHAGEVRDVTVSKGVTSRTRRA
jgi:DNA-binding IclR family transcriptional regulator